MMETMRNAAKGWVAKILIGMLAVSFGVWGIADVFRHLGSGALATANRALEIGRELMAVPGPITSMASAGPNRLLHQGLARAVSNADEVESLLLSSGESPSTEGQRTPKPEIELNLEMRAILDALSVKVARTVDQVAKRTDLDPVSCTAQLGVLELMGKARRGVAGWQRSA